MTVRRLFGSISVVGALVLSGCSFGEGTVGAVERVSKTAPEKPSLTVAAVDLPESIDPARLDPLDALEVLVSELLYDGLTAVDESGEVVPSLAESWSSEDGMTWYFQLNEGQLFGDGSEVTATAVVDSLMRTRETSGSLPSVTVGSVDSVSSDDAGEVIIRTEEPSWEVPKLLAEPGLGIVGPGEHLGSPVTSGVYSLVAAGTGEWLMSGAEQASYSQILIRSAVDDSAAVDLLDEGLVDVAIGTDLPEPAVEVEESTLASAVIYLGLRRGSQGLETSDERRALLASLDREELPIGRHQQLATSFSPLASLSDVCTGTCDAIESEPLSEMDLGLDYLQSDTFEQIAVAVAEQLDTEDVSVELKKRAGDDLGDVLADPHQSLVLFALTGVSESPDTYLSSGFGSDGALNILGIESSDLDEKLAAARAIEDDDARLQEYVEIEQLIVTKGWAVPLVQTGPTILASANSGFDAAEYFGTQLRS